MSTVCGIVWEINNIIIEGDRVHVDRLAIKSGKYWVNKKVKILLASLDRESPN